MRNTIKIVDGTRFGYPEFTKTEIADFFVKNISNPEISFVFGEFITSESFCHSEMTNCEDLFTFLISPEIRFLVHSLSAGIDID
jgi:hypothetical protein